MDTISYDEYRRLIKRLSSILWSSSARRRIEDFVLRDPVKALEYAATALNDEYNPRVLEATLYSLFTRVLGIEGDVVDSYLHRHIMRGYRFLLMLLRDLSIIFSRGLLGIDELRNTVYGDLRESKHPVYLHLIARLAEGASIDSILKDILGNDVPLVPLETVYEVPVAGTVNAVSWVPERDLLVVGSDQGALLAIDRGGSIVWNLGGVAGFITSLSVSRSGRYVAAGYDKGVLLLDTYGNILQKLDLGGRVRSVAWSPKSDLLAVSVGKMVIVYSIDGGGEKHMVLTPIWEQGFNGYINSVSWSPSDESLLVGGASVLDVVDIASRSTRPLKYVDTTVYSASWSPSGRSIAVVTGYKNYYAKLTVYNRGGGKIWEYSDLKGVAYSVSYNPVSEYIILGTFGSNEILVFNDRGSIVSRRDIGKGVRTVSWDNDGEMVAVGGDLGRVVVLKPYIDWERICSYKGGYRKSGTDYAEILSMDLCRKLWKRHLAKYLFLRDLGIDASRYLYLGLYGLSTLRDYIVLSKLGKPYTSLYTKIIASTLYIDKPEYNIIGAKHLCHNMVQALEKISSVLEDNEALIDIDRFLKSLENNIWKKDLAFAVTYIEQVAKEISRALGKYTEIKRFFRELGFREVLGKQDLGKIKSIDELEELYTKYNKLYNLYTKLKELIQQYDNIESVRNDLTTCINSLEVSGDLYGNMDYCIRLLERGPALDIELEGKEVDYRAWNRVILRIANKEKVPITVSSIEAGKELEVKVEGNHILCRPGTVSDIELYIKPLKKDHIATHLEISCSIEGLNKVFKVGIPIELLSRSTVEEEPLNHMLEYPLPALDTIYSLKLGLPEYIVHGTVYRVLWRKQYTAIWSYGGVMECTKLGCGGWGCSYVCKAGQQEVVVKIPHGYEGLINGSDVPTVNPRLLRRISRLSETIIQLKHPGIIRLLGYGIRVPVLVYEYANQGALSYHLNRGYRPGLEEALAIVLHLSDALRYIHSRGLVHGDIKPGNILVKNGISKLGDFSSLTRLLSRTSSRSRVTSCTPGYCAPEQIYIDLKAKAREYGVENRVDVYQLANLTLELLGLDPIDGSEILEVDLDGVVSEIEDPRLSALLARMLSYKPWERPNIEDVERTIYSVLSSRRQEP